MSGQTPSMNPRYPFFRLAPFHSQYPSFAIRLTRGVKAQRLAVGESLPRNGWLVRGAFAEVDQGSRVLRSQVGFGTGATDLAVLVNVADLQKGKLEPFYKLEAQAGSRRMPGAAVTRNPYVAAAKFVMSRRDLPKNIRQIAQTVADQIIRRAK
jgi:Domain of unknown function (DUF4410)